jgi:hypothetical protein
MIKEFCHRWLCEVVEESQTTRILFALGIRGMMFQERETFIAVTIFWRHVDLLLQPYGDTMADFENAWDSQWEKTKRKNLELVRNCLEQRLRI